jgi:hypothetical protein
MHGGNVPVRVRWRRWAYNPASDADNLHHYRTGGDAGNQRQHYGGSDGCERQHQCRRRLDVHSDWFLRQLQSCPHSQRRLDHLYRAFGIGNGYDHG